MMTIRGQDDEAVQVLEVPVVPRQDGPPVTDGVGQVGLVTASGQSYVGWNLDIVPVTAQQSYEAGIDAVVDDVKPHRPSLRRSSVERGRGLPLNLMAGSFMPVASLRMSSLRLSSRNSGGSLAQYSIASRTASTGMPQSSASCSGVRGSFSMNDSQ